MSRKPILTLADLHAYFIRRAGENKRRAFKLNVDDSPEESIADRNRFIGKAAAYENAAGKVKLLMNPSWKRGSNG